MNQSTTERSFILVFRLLMAWTFLYAASHQGMFNPKLQRCWIPQPYENLPRRLCRDCHPGG